MDPQLRVQYLSSRLENYYHIMRTVFFAFVGIAAILQFGPDGISFVLAALVIAVTAYGILAGGATLDDLDNLRQDIDETVAQTNYGRNARTRNVGALKMASTGLIGLVGLVELLAALF